MTEQQSVLIIDDADEIHDLVEARLRPENLVLHHAFDAPSGVAQAFEYRPDLVLLDLDLGGASGLEVCRELKADPRTAAIPVICLTGTADTATKVLAFDLGAVDYVTKPFDAVELRARVRSALRTKRYHDLLQTRAQLDGLTTLWNRAFFDLRLEEEVAVSQRTSDPLALAMVDVDHFKRLNDTCGHPFGDEVLRQVAEALVKSVRRSDVVCRYGGEEFGVILRGATTQAATLAAERLRKSVSALRPSHRSEVISITASVGLATSEDFGDPDGLSRTALVVAADAALYRAKREGRDRVVRAQPGENSRKA